MAKNKFHQEILRLCGEMGPFLVGKNEKYGDATRRISRMLEIVFPKGIPVHRIEDVYFIIMVFNKICRVAEDHKQEDEDPWLDTAGYAILAHAKRRLERDRERESEQRGQSRENLAAGRRRAKVHRLHAGRGSVDHERVKRVGGKTK